MLRRHADPVFHETSQTDRPGFALIPDEAPLHISRSKNVMHVGLLSFLHFSSIFDIWHYEHWIQE